eukprot:COSAG01_NODE_8116_length_2915_cov_2.975497_6_plen_47_part_01
MCLPPVRLLAAALGTGEVVVYTVPRPADVAAAAAAAAAAASGDDDLW